MCKTFSISKKITEFSFNIIITSLAAFCSKLLVDRTQVSSIVH